MNKNIDLFSSKGPIAFIEVAESSLYKKVNGMLGLAKDAMKRKGYEFCVEINAKP